MITYQASARGISEKHLNGFFVGWRKKPTKKTHLRLLKNSDYVVIARDNKTGNAVGFITAVSDGVLAAYIPFLEVVPKFQDQGIGNELASRMLLKLKDFYMVDLLCDEPLQPFYEKLGMRKAVGMMIRNRLMSREA